MSTRLEASRLKVRAADLAADGWTNSRIAEELDRDETTVERYLSEWRRVLGALDKTELVERWRDFRQTISSDGLPLHPRDGLPAAAGVAKAPGPATFEILEADAELVLNDDVTWSSTVRRTIQVSPGHTLRHLRHWNAEPKNSDSVFLDYLCEGYVDSIEGMTSRAEFRLALRPADAPNEANHIFEFRPPLTAGCIATYTVAQRYGGTPTLAREAADAALQRVDYVGWAGISKGWLIDHTTYFLKRRIFLPSWYRIEGVEVLVSEKGNPDPNETVRAEAGFSVERSEAGFQMSLEIERPVLNYRYAIRWFPLPTAKPPAG